MILVGNTSHLYCPLPDHNLKTFVQAIDHLMLLYDMNSCEDETSLSEDPMIEKKVKVCVRKHDLFMIIRKSMSNAESNLIFCHPHSTHENRRRRLLRKS